MGPNDTATDESNEGLMNMELVCNGLLRPSLGSQQFYPSHSFRVKFSSVAKLASFVLAVVAIRALKPVRRIVANVVIASVQHVKRIRVETVDNEPSHSCGVSVITFDRHLALRSPNLAAYGGSPRPTFVRTTLVNMLPVSSFLFVGK